MPLEEAVEALLASRTKAVIEIVGDAGSGKTTALKHLAAVLPDAARIFFRDTEGHGSIGDPDQPFAIIASNKAEFRDEFTLHLRSWSRDDWLEYLLATHPSECGSVLERLAAVRPGAELRTPELCRIVLDEMAADRACSSTDDAFRSYFNRHAPEHLIRTLGMYCLAVLQNGSGTVADLLQSFGRNTIEPKLLGLTRHEPIRLLLAADAAIGRLAELNPRGQARFLAKYLPPALIRGIAARLRHKSGLLDSLKRSVKKSRAEARPTLVSIIAAADSDWRPPRRLKWLGGAYLRHVQWAGIDLTAVELRNANLGGANLAGAQLNRANVASASLLQANLSRASLVKVNAVSANFEDANLSLCTAMEAGFSNANLRGANLSGAKLRSAIFGLADLTGAQLCEADLTRADLTNAIVVGTDFTHAILDQAVLKQLDLRETILAGASFSEAVLRGCNLEGQMLPGANFFRANLAHAYLTDSRMPDAKFEGAILRETGLADIDWEGADLRGADLRGCSFFLGSSRSGLVNSPLACEGSRTGFYTDDWEEQHFKAPEEIRKANLCGADLRGAKIEGVDFYLVDLRGAKYTPEQRAQLEGTGAILANRCA